MGSRFRGGPEERRESLSSRPGGSGVSLVLLRRWLTTLFFVSFCVWRILWFIFLLFSYLLVFYLLWFFCFCFLACFFSFIFVGGKHFFNGSFTCSVFVAVKYFVFFHLNWSFYQFCFCVWSIIRELNFVLCFCVCYCFHPHYVVVKYFVTFFSCSIFVSGTAFCPSHVVVKYFVINISCSVSVSIIVFILLMLWSTLWTRFCPVFSSPLLFIYPSYVFGKYYV